MSQETTYTRQRSYSSSNNTTIPKSPRASETSTSPKTGHRYSSSANGRLTRHYATLEESDAVIPVFSTPTHMYIRQELNSHSRASPQYTAASQKQPTTSYSPTQSFSGNSKNFTSNGYHEPSKPPGSPLGYGRTRAESTAARPTTDIFTKESNENEVNKAEPISQASSLPQKDLLLAQLIDMGFSLEASQVAITASGGTNLQDILDILVQNAKVEKQFPIPPPPSSNPRAANNHNQPPPPPSSNPRPTSYHNQPPPPPSSNPRPTSYHNQPPPPPSSNPKPTSNYNQPPPPSSQSDDEDEDPVLEKEKEEKFKREQEERRREYFDQLKREKPIPPTPSPRSPMEPVSAYADRERKQGNFLFNKGQYSEAETCYSSAIASLPTGHGELVLLCNNRAAARLKLGKYHACLSDCSVAIDIARNQMAYSAILGDTTWKSQMIKALHRKASALEGLCLFESAIQVYEEYVRLDGSRNLQANQGILRCQQALLEKNQSFNNQQPTNQPPPQPPRPTNGPTWKPANDNSAFPDIDFNMFIPKQTPEQTAAKEEINKSKAVQEMREREKQKEAEDAERLRNEDKVNAKILAWKSGKDKNLRALLGSLSLILWPGVQWKSVQMNELIEPRKCKITYMKAIAKVHPDKLPSNATVEQRMLASSIFTTLNQAWDLFKIENNL